MIQARTILLDAGPLVALVNVREKYHAWTKSQMAAMRPPLLTCEAALTEACFLVRAVPEGPQVVMQMVAEGVVRIPFRLEEHAAAIGALMARYASASMSLADACLVRMAEEHRGSTVFTLDSDFRIYRKGRKRVIPVLMPDDL